MKFKNFLLISFSLLFGLGVVVFSAFRVSQAEVMAQTEEEVAVIEIGKEEEGVEKEEAVEATEGAEKTAAAEELKEEELKEVDYYLPYPGILPDHPLYWLKMIRDRILLALTNNPVDKFERFLLYADKRIGAAEVLIKGNKAELGVTTADKAEKYLGQAVEQFEELAKTGKATPEMHDRISKAISKHMEILAGVLDKVSDQTRPTLSQAMERAQRYSEKIKSQFR
jgi:hypothetical protein